MVSIQAWPNVQAFDRAAVQGFKLAVFHDLWLAALQHLPFIPLCRPDSLQKLSLSCRHHEEMSVWLLEDMINEHPKVGDHLNDNQIQKLYDLIKAGDHKGPVSSSACCTLVLVWTASLLCHVNSFPAIVQMYRCSSRLYMLDTLMITH